MIIQENYDVMGFLSWSSLSYKTVSEREHAKSVDQDNNSSSGEGDDNMPLAAPLD